MEPVWISANVDFVNGQGILKITNKTITQTYLTCNTVMDSGLYSAVVSGKNGGSVTINAYNAGVPYTGMLWVVTSGLIQVR